MAIRDIYKTGDLSPNDAYFEWLMYYDQTTKPSPHDGETKIFVKKDEPLPLINSSNKISYWQLVSYRNWFRELYALFFILLSVLILLVLILLKLCYNMPIFQKGDILWFWKFLIPISDIS